MHWKRLGRIFNPEDYPDWAGSHAQVPTVHVMPDRFRIYYADRNRANKSFPTFIDVDIEDPKRLIHAKKTQILTWGDRGMFDDEGVMPGDVVERDGVLWMYYTGWNQGVTVPYRNSIGLAVSEDGGETFRRLFAGPIVDRSAEEPLMAVTPFILREAGFWRMWYVSGTQWVEVAGKLEPVYVVKDARSSDGTNWERRNYACIPPVDEFEAQAHPSVLRSGGGYRMWYCFRRSKDFRDGAGSYRIGYAESGDGNSWTRKDAEGGLDVSREGWDSSMTCYPYVVNAHGKTYMFYNGNGFGQSGIGCAVLET